MGYCCAVLIRTNSITIRRGWGQGATFLYSTGDNDPESSQIGRKRRSGANAEVLEGRQSSSAWRAVEVVGKVRQEGLECHGTASAGGHPFLQLRKQIVNKAVQIVGIVTVRSYSGFGQFQERSVPSGDPNGRGQSNRSRWVGDIKDSGKGITHRAN